MMKMDGRDRAECQNWEKRDINVTFRKVFKSLDDKNEQCRLLKWVVAGAESGSSSWLRFLKFVLEREPLLFRNTGDPTVSSLRDKKESCYTRRGLRVSTGFLIF